MDEIKEQFKKDFMESNKVDLSFDTDQLEPNDRHDKHRIRPYKLGLLITCAVILAIVMVPTSVILFSSIGNKSSVKTYNRKYTKNEIRIAESNTFKKLNDVYYPSNDKPTRHSYSIDRIEAYDNFSNLTYHSLVDTSKKDNMSYSIVGLYSMLNEMTIAASREELKNDLNELLGLDEEARTYFYKSMILANSFVREQSTTQIKNAVFFNNRFNYNQYFVGGLSKLYCEAYQLSFENEADKIVEWVNQAVDSDGFINKDFLEMNNETQLYLFSTLYFKHAWAKKYLSNDNFKDEFYLSNGESVKTTYMKHSYMLKHYYDHGSYISFDDYYYNQYASVTYIVPKKTEDNIFNLTKNVNIFEENEDNIVRSSNGWFTVHLQTPKFNTKSDVDFKQSLINLGFGDIFNRNIDSFANAFDDENLDDYNIYLQGIKQRNEVEFNEDGSEVKSVSIARMGAGSIGPGSDDTLDVKLNQPFIYIIRDCNDTPIFVGHIDNPQAK